MRTTQKMQPAQQFMPAIIATVLVLLGVLGLWSTTRKDQTASTPSQGILTVQSAQSGNTSQSQTGAATQLQGAAQVKDFINGKDGSSVQQGGSVDQLLKDKTIN